MNDTIGTRMKEFYESVPKTKLLRRTPVIIRIDGKAFHTFTRGFDRPYDEVLMKTMQRTALELCKQIQGCVLAYTQSDEISLLLVDYQTLESGAWFDYEVQKLCSVAASIATAEFNRILMDVAANDARDDERFKFYAGRFFQAMFDARCFNVPKEEVANYFFWRQLDAERNSVQMLAQSLYSPKQLHKKNVGDLIAMCEKDYGLVWGNLPTPVKRGSCCVKKDGKWTIDLDIPRFKEEGRLYVEDLTFYAEE